MSLSRKHVTASDLRSRTKAILGSKQKTVLFTLSVLLWVSGIVWLSLKCFSEVQGEFGLESHPDQPMWLKIHGAVAMGFLMIFGAILIHHVPAGWQQKSQRPSGFVLLMTCCLLIATGWGLYYLGGEEVRAWTSLLHWTLGLLFPAFLVIHVWLAKRKIKRNLMNPLDNF